MDVWLGRWLPLALGALLVAAVTALLLGRRAAAQPAPTPAPPAPPEPDVLPGDHRATALFPAPGDDDRRWGYIDVTGRFVIAPRWTFAKGFSEGLAFVGDPATGRTRCIDKNNQVVFDFPEPPPTGWLGPEGGFREGLALVIHQGTAVGNRYTYIDRAGKLLGPPRFYPAQRFSGGLAAVAENGKWGFLAPDGSLAIPLRYQWAFDFSDGRAGVVLKKRVGYIDRAGKLVIPDRYEVADGFSEGLAPVQPGSPERGDTTEMGFIDPAGHMAIKPRFLHAHGFHEGRARVLVSMSPDRWGFIDPTGKLVIPGRYDQAQDMSDGLAAVRLAGKWGYVDRDGREVIAPSFLTAGDFAEGLAYVWLDPGRQGYIDKTGREIRAWRLKPIQ